MYPVCSTRNLNLGPAHLVFRPISQCALVEWLRSATIAVKAKSLISPNISKALLKLMTCLCLRWRCVAIKTLSSKSTEVERKYISTLMSSRRFSKWWRRFYFSDSLSSFFLPESLTHTIRKVKFLSKNSILTTPNIFTIFSPIFFFWQFFSWNQSYQ